MLEKQSSFGVIYGAGDVPEKFILSAKINQKLDFVAEFSDLETARRAAIILNDADDVPFLHSEERRRAGRSPDGVAITPNQIVVVESDRVFEVRISLADRVVTVARMSRRERAEQLRQLLGRALIVRM